MKPKVINLAAWSWKKSGFHHTLRTSPINGIVHLICGIRWPSVSMLFSGLIFFMNLSKRNVAVLNTTSIPKVMAKVCQAHCGKKPMTSIFIVVLGNLESISTTNYEWSMSCAKLRCTCNYHICVKLWRNMMMNGANVCRNGSYCVWIYRLCNQCALILGTLKQLKAM